MTTFVIPTFLITFAKGFVVGVAIYMAISVIGTALYSYLTARNIERQMRIDAEIDRLHK